MKTRSARHRVTDGVAAIDVNRKRSATGEMKGQQNGAGDGSVGNQPPAGYLQRLWAWLRRPQARGKTNHHIRRSRRLSHFATLKTMPELADVPSKCISSPAYRSGSAWEMEYAGKDMMTLLGDAMKSSCSPSDLRNAALVCKEWRSMLGYAPAVASILRGDDAFAIAKMLAAKDIESVVQHHISDFVRVLARTAETEEDDTFLATSVADLGNIWMFAFKLSWNSHAEQMIEAWLKVFVTRVREMHLMCSDGDPINAAITCIGPVDRNDADVDARLVLHMDLRQTVRRIGEALVPRLGDIIDRASRRLNNIMQSLNNLWLHRFHDFIGSPSHVDPSESFATREAVEVDIDNLVAYSLVIRAVFLEFPREASVHLRSLLPLLSIEFDEVQGYLLFEFGVQNAFIGIREKYLSPGGRYATYVKTMQENFSVVINITDALLAMQKVVKNGWEPDGLHDALLQALLGSSGDKKLELVRAFPTVAARNLSWLYEAITLPDDYVHDEEAGRDADVWDHIEAGVNLVCCLLDTEVQFDGNLIMDRLVRLVPFDRGPELLWAINELVRRELTDLRPDAHVIADVLDRPNYMKTRDQAITAFGLLGDEAEPHLDRFMEQMKEVLVQETGDRFVQTLYEHRYRLKQNHLRDIILCLNESDWIPEIVTALETVRVLCKTEEDATQIMYTMFYEMLDLTSEIDDDGQSYFPCNGGNYLFEAIQYVALRVDEPTRREILQYLRANSKGPSSQNPYRWLSMLHIRAMIEKDVSPALALDHMLEMYDNNDGDRRRRDDIVDYKVEQLEIFNEGRRKLRSEYCDRLAELRLQAEDAFDFLSSSDEEDADDDRDSTGSEDIEF